MSELHTIKRLDIRRVGDAASEHFQWAIDAGRSPNKLDGIADGQLDCIRSFLVLQTIGHGHTVAVLREWGRALRVGGELFISVPDFERIVDGYMRGSGEPHEALLMGDQTSDGDCNRAIFTRQKLAEALALAGFAVDSDWESQPESPCEIRVRAINRRVYRWPIEPQTDVICIMSLPRLAWTENMHCILIACKELQMAFARSTGVFWGQCLQRLLEEAIAAKRHRYALVVDYDSVFEASDVVHLRKIMERHKLHALAAMQAARERDDILTMLDDGNGKPMTEIDSSRLADDHWPCLTAHFGLTLIDLEALAKVPTPFFLGIPMQDGTWGDQRIDDDIYFWRKVRDAGMRCSVTPQVLVGHIQTLCSWVGPDLKPRHQYMKDYLKSGRPTWTE